MAVAMEKLWYLMAVFIPQMCKLCVWRTLGNHLVHLTRHTKLFALSRSTMCLSPVFMQNKLNDEIIDALKNTLPKVVQGHHASAV